MSVDNRTTVNARIFNINYYHQADSFLYIEKSEDPDIPLRDASLLHRTAPCASSPMYGFLFSRGELSVTFPSVVSGDDVTTPSICGMIVGHPFLNNGAKGL